MTNSSGAGKKFVPHFLKTIAYGLSAYLLGTTALNVVSTARQSISQTADKATDEAGRKFDLSLKPLILSLTPIKIASIETAEPALATCILSQNPTSLMTLKNGSLQAAGPVAIDLGKLRECYKAAARDESKNESAGTMVLAGIFTLGLTFGTAAAGILSVSHLGGTGMTGAQYLPPPPQGEKRRVG